MPFPYIIPTIDEPMSTYTAMVFGFMFAAIPVGIALGYGWVKKEFRRVDKNVDAHNDFVIVTSETMARMQTDIAVIAETAKSQRSDMHDLKESMAGINKTLWTQFVK